MNPRVLLFLSSLALNGVCLLAFALRPTAVPMPVRDFFARHFSSSSRRSAGSANPAPPPKPVERRKLWPTLDTAGDLATLIGRLRGAGFPADIIRAMVLSEISARYDTKLRTFFEPDGNTPFWKMQSNIIGSDDKRMQEYARVQRERAKLQRDLFADPFFASDDITAAQRRQFGNLSRQKIDLLQRIEDDYADMSAALRSNTHGILLEDDRAKLDLLMRERRTDLASVLSAEELADYMMRSSPMTSLLARNLSGFNATEAEFRVIFQAQQAFSESLGPTGPMGVDSGVRHGSSQQLQDDLKAGLGPARYADYVRETDRNYQQLTRLVERANLPADTAVRAFDIRDAVAQESGRIVDNAALTVEQKRTELQSLAERTRTELLGILGPSAGPAYVKLVDQQWLNTVQRGNAVSFGGNGSSMMSYSMSQGNGLPVSVAFGTGVSFRNVTTSARPGSP